MADSNVFRLSRYWPYRLHVLATRVSNTLAQVYAERFGISVPEWRIIAALGGLDRGEALSGTALTALTAMDRVQVSRAMARMLEAKLIVRGTGREDRRTAQASLTPKGRRIYEQVVPLARAYEQQLLTALDPEDQNHLDRLVAKLAAQADRLAALPREAIGAPADSDGTGESPDLGRSAETEPADGDPAE